MVNLGDKMKCKKCGSEEIIEKVMYMPYAWGQGFGVIKMPSYYWVCKECDSTDIFK